MAWLTVLAIIFVLPFIPLLLFLVLIVWLWAVKQVIESILYLKSEIKESIQHKKEQALKEKEQEERMKNKPTVEEIKTLEIGDIIEVDYLGSVTIIGWVQGSPKRGWTICSKEKAEGIRESWQRNVSFDHITKILERREKWN